MHAGRKGSLLRIEAFLHGLLSQLLFLALLQFFQLKGCVYVIDQTYVLMVYLCIYIYALIYVYTYVSIVYLFLYLFVWPVHGLS